MLFYSIERGANMSIQDTQEEFIRQLTNLVNKDILQQNIINSALFILFFESLKDLIIDRLCGFFCFDISIKNNKISRKESIEYKQEVRSLDTNIFDASLKWYQNEKILSNSDVEKIKQIEKRRNEIVHELSSVLIVGLSQDDISLLLNVIQIYDNLDSWWIYNFEADLVDIPNRETLEQKDCHSVAAITLHIILDVLYSDADKYADWPEQIKAAVLKKRSQAREKENG